MLWKYAIFNQDLKKKNKEPSKTSLKAQINYIWAKQT